MRVSFDSVHLKLSGHRYLCKTEYVFETFSIMIILEQIEQRWLHKNACWRYNGSFVRRRGAGAQNLQKHIYFFILITFSVRTFVGVEAAKNSRNWVLEGFWLWMTPKLVTRGLLNAFALNSYCGQDLNPTQNVRLVGQERVFVYPNIRSQWWN